MTLKELRKAYQDNFKLLLKAHDEGRREDHLKYLKIEKKLHKAQVNMWDKISSKASEIPDPTETLK